MFSRILHANDGSEHAFHALTVALAIAKQNESALHMVSVEEIDYMPEFVEEVREETGTAAAAFIPFSSAPARWRKKASETEYPCCCWTSCALHCHACGRSQGGIARDRARGHSALYERLLGAAPIVSCTLPSARCSS